MELSLVLCLLFVGEDNVFFFIFGPYMRLCFAFCLPRIAGTILCSLSSVYWWGRYPLLFFHSPYRSTNILKLTWSSVLMASQKSAFILLRCRGDRRRGMDWRLDLLSTYTHDSELQVITALSLISTLYKSPKHPLNLFSVCHVFVSRSLGAASNSGDSSSSRAQAVSSQPPLQNSCQPITD
jgi:hypothetical protein